MSIHLTYRRASCGRGGHSITHGISNNKILEENDVAFWYGATTFRRTAIGLSKIVLRRWQGQYDTQHNDIQYTN